MKNKDILRKSLIKILLVGSALSITPLVLVNGDSYREANSRLNELGTPNQKIELAEKMKKNYQTEDTVYKFLNLGEYIAANNASK